MHWPPTELANLGLARKADQEHRPVLIPYADLAPDRLSGRGTGVLADR